MATAVVIGVRFITKLVNFNTPGILNGGGESTIWTPQVVGETILPLGWVNVLTAWDGTTPVIRLFPQGGAGTDALSGSAALNVADTVQAFNGTRIAKIPSWPTASVLTVVNLTPVEVRVDTGTGGVSPGSTQGQARIVLAVGVGSRGLGWNGSELLNEVRVS